MRTLAQVLAPEPEKKPAPKKAEKPKPKPKQVRRKTVRMTARSWAAGLGPEYARTLTALGPEFSTKLLRALRSRRRELDLNTKVTKLEAELAKRRMELSEVKAAADAVNDCQARMEKVIESMKEPAGTVDVGQGGPELSS